ncbi:MAG: sensor histidine kinase [Bacillota bacterium]
MNISLMAFNLLSFLLLILIIHYAKYQFEEKEKTNLLYQELKSYASRVKELTVAEERNRIAMEIHDAVGHGMTGLIMELEMCKRILPEDPTSAKEFIIRATETARKSLIDVRRAVDALKYDDRHLQSPIQSYQEMIHRFQAQSGIHVHLQLSPEKISVPAPIAAIIYRMIQEALTNAGRHSNCSEITITLSMLSNQIILDICDNGICNPNYKEGNGLKGIRRRMEEIQGQIRFSCSDGFRVHGVIPITPSCNMIPAKNQSE